MSVSKKKLINYLNHFKVSELREITKYMGQNITKQNGGYYNKPQMIYNLVGGMDTSVTFTLDVPVTGTPMTPPAARAADPLGRPAASTPQRQPRGDPSASPPRHPPAPASPPPPPGEPPAPSSHHPHTRPDMRGPLNCCWQVPGETSVE